MMTPAHQDPPKPQISGQLAVPSLIGITMGCPVGIGPEIIVRFLMGSTSSSLAFKPVVLGDLGVLKETAGLLGATLEFVAWRPEGPLPLSDSAVIPVVQCSELDCRTLKWGRPTRETGQAMAVPIERAVALIQQGVLAGMVTCPISKASLNNAGYHFPGHTEMLATLCQASDYAMMMAASRLRVALVSIHEPLARVSSLICRAAVLRMIRMVGLALRRDFGILQPRIAVAGLNPHAGEDNIFGNEETKEIEPAVRDAKAEGWQVVGPLPPDTVFVKAAAGDFDAVVCMYHDQGLIPFKLLHFADGVNVTLGLPIVRTSVDHGTAYDIAGRGLASPTSLAAAFEMATAIVVNRRGGVKETGKND